MPSSPRHRLQLTLYIAVNCKIFIIKKTADDFNWHRPIYNYKSQHTSKFLRNSFFYSMKIIFLRYNLLNSFDIIVRMTTLRKFISGQLINMGKRNTRVGTLIVATIYLQLIQNRYMFRSFTVLQCSHQHCVQPIASDVEVVGYL